MSTVKRKDQLHRNGDQSPVHTSQKDLDVSCAPSRCCCCSLFSLSVPHKLLPVIKPMSLWYDPLGWVQGNREDIFHARPQSPIHVISTAATQSKTTRGSRPSTPNSVMKGAPSAPKAKGRGDGDGDDKGEGQCSFTPEETVPGISSPSSSCAHLWSTDIHSAYYTLDPVAFTIHMEDSNSTRLPTVAAPDSDVHYAFSVAFELLCGSTSANKRSDKSRTVLTTLPVVFRFIDAVYTPSVNADFSSGSSSRCSVAAAAGQLEVAPENNSPTETTRVVSFVLSEPVIFPVRIADLPVDTEVHCCVTWHLPPCTGAAAADKKEETEQWGRNAPCGSANENHMGDPSALATEVGGSWDVFFSAFDEHGGLFVGPHRYSMHSTCNRRSTSHNVGFEVTEADGPLPTTAVAVLEDSTDRIKKEELLLRDHYEGRFVPPAIPWLDTMTEKHIQKLRAGAPRLSFSAPVMHPTSSSSSCYESNDPKPMSEASCDSHRSRSINRNSNSNRSSCVWVGYPLPSQPYPICAVSEGTRLAALSNFSCRSLEERRHRDHERRDPMQRRLVHYVPRRHYKQAASEWRPEMSSTRRVLRERRELFFRVNSTLTYPDFGYCLNVVQKIGFTAPPIANTEAALTNYSLHYDPTPNESGMGSSRAVFSTTTGMINTASSSSHSSNTALNVYEAQAALLSSSLYALLSDARTPPGPRERQRLLELASLPPIPLMASVITISSASLEPKSLTGAANGERMSSATTDTKRMRADDISLLWRFRHFICRDTRYFVPFLRSVHWTVDVDSATENGNTGTAGRSEGRRLAQQQQAAQKVMGEWTSISLADIFACLSPAFSGVSAVRRFAISHLQKQFEGKSDQQNELLCRYSLPLLHAVRYDSESHHELATFLVARSSLPASRRAGAHHQMDPTTNTLTTPSSANHVFIASGGCWPLCCEVYWGAVVEGSLEERKGTKGETTTEPQPNSNHANHRPAAPGPLCHLRDMLQEALARDAPSYLLLLEQQRRLVDCLKTLSARLIAHGGHRTSLIERGKKKLRSGSYGFRELFDRSSPPTTVTAHDWSRAGDTSAGRAGSGIYPNLTALRSAVTLPSHPERVILGVEWSDFHMFKSAKRPMQVTFLEDTTTARAEADRRLSDRTGIRGNDPSGSGRPSGRTAASASSRMTMMFKVDDDVRQDELVMAMLGIMDQLLKQEGLDLHLTLYRVRPTNPTDGLLEIVPDVVTFESIKGDILHYWSEHNPSPALLEAAKQRYIRSLAGYSVITFILGVGDRHLENILMAGDGRLLHIDFGYIFGHNPTPRLFSPPMKLRPEMIAALGGPQSNGYHVFQTLCCSAYNILRKHSSLLLYVLTSFSDAHDMTQVTERVKMSEPAGSGSTRDVPLVALLGVQEKLRLNLTNAQAAQYMMNTISQSVNAIVDVWSDRLHSVAQRTRN